MARNLPDARPTVVEDAGLLLITSHPDECAAFRADFLDDVG